MKILVLIVLLFPVISGITAAHFGKRSYVFTTAIVTREKSPQEIQEAHDKAKEDKERLERARAAIRNLQAGDKPEPTIILGPIQKVKE